MITVQTKHYKTVTIPPPSTNWNVRGEGLLTTLLPSENSLIRLIAYRLIQSSGPLMKWAYCFVRKRYF
jgi:hypothetical protein